MRNQRFALGIAVAVGLGCAWEASAQDFAGHVPLVHTQDRSLILMSYDGDLLPYADAEWLGDVCTAEAPCSSATIVIDLPTWTETDSDLASFRTDIREVMTVASDPHAFESEPIFFVMSSDDATATDVRDIISEEAYRVGLQLRIPQASE